MILFIVYTVQILKGDEKHDIRSWFHYYHYYYSYYAAHSHLPQSFKLNAKCNECRAGILEF